MRRERGVNYHSKCQIWTCLGWAEAFADRVLEEYLRLMVLKAALRDLAGANWSCFFPRLAAGGGAWYGLRAGTVWEFARFYKLV